MFYDFLWLDPDPAPQHWVQIFFFLVMFQCCQSELIKFWSRTKRNVFFLDPTPILIGHCHQIWDIVTWFGTLSPDLLLLFSWILTRLGPLIDLLKSECGLKKLFHENTKTKFVLQPPYWQHYLSAYIAVCALSPIWHINHFLVTMFCSLYTAGTIDLS